MGYMDSIRFLSGTGLTVLREMNGPILSSMLDPMDEFFALDLKLYPCEISGSNNVYICVSGKNRAWSTDAVIQRDNNGVST